MSPYLVLVPEFAETDTDACKSTPGDPLTGVTDMCEAPPLEIDQDTLELKSIVNALAAYPMFAVDVSPQGSHRSGIVPVTAV
jgi:hypothetical protein